MHADETAPCARKIDAHLKLWESPTCHVFRAIPPVSAKLISGASKVRFRLQPLICISRFRDHTVDTPPPPPGGSILRKINFSI